MRQLGSGMALNGFSCTLFGSDFEYAAVLRQFVVAVGIDLGEHEAPFIFGGQFLQDRLECAAGLAPVGPEIDDDGHPMRGIEHLVGEIRAGNIEGVGGHGAGKKGTIRRRV